MKSKNYTKEDIKILLTVSATTFAIFVFLGSAIPIILSKGTELTANLWTNGLWLIGVGINPINVSDFLGIPVYNESGRLNDTDTLLPGKAYWIYVDEHHYVLIHYDTDKDGKISGRELLKAIKDWKDNKLTGRQLLIVIDLWRQS